LILQKKDLRVGSLQKKNADNIIWNKRCEQRLYLILTIRAKDMEIFISHSQQDKAVAVEFKKVFEEFGNYLKPEIIKNSVEVFLSSKLSTEQEGDGKWKENFETHLGNSDVIVILVSPKSINSRWVQYETGYAMAMSKMDKDKVKKIIQIGIRGATPEKILLNDNYIQYVRDSEEFQRVCAKIFDVSEKFAKGWCTVNKSEMQKLINLCNERCVYFVGSRPEGELEEGENWKELFRMNFISELTKELLDKGCKISSYPTVKDVGMLVYNAAKNKNLKLYEISGLYNFDKPLTISKDETIELDTWNNYLSEFRKHYLENKDSMIIIGGNNHTKQECEVAEKLGYIELFPIPCLGGFAKEKYDEMSEDDWRFDKLNHPCKECYKNGDFIGKTTCPQLKKFTERLEQYRYINEDERES